MEDKCFVIVRTYGMGCSYGELDPASTETLKILKNARKLHYWDGAATLAQLAETGTVCPEKCRFTAPVSRVELTSPQGFEVFDVTEAGRASIASVKEWRR